MRLLLPLLCLLAPTNAAKIAMFAAPMSNSQMIFSLRLAEVLADDGHDVVVIRPSWNPNANAVSKHPKVREIRVQGIINPETFTNFTRVEHKVLYEDVGFSGLTDMAKYYSQMVNEVCHSSINDDVFLQKLRDEKFDIAFQHHIDFCNVGLIHHLGIPKFVSTMAGPPHRNLFIDLGIPFLTTTFPGIIMRTTNKMSFTERAKTLAISAFLDYYGPKNADEVQNKMFQEKFGEEFLSIQELKLTHKMTFVNADSLIEYPIGTTNKMQFIGGIGMKRTQPLQEPYLSFVKNAKKLVVVSFGSVAVASEMPQTWKDSFIGLFKMNPTISFVWKFEEEIAVPSNVLRSKWIPQNDLLVKSSAFITHGGYNSLGEAVGAGVPCVFVPLFADQYRNALLAEYRGFGIPLPKVEISAAALNERLHRLLEEEKYSATAKELQHIVSNRLVEPEAVLRYWTRFLLEHDIDMDMPTLTFFQLYSIDVIGSGVAAILLLLLILRTLGRLYYWSCCEMSYEKKEKLKIQ